MSSTFGAQVRFARTKREISQRNLANRCGVDFSYISKIENDRTGTPPSEKVIDRICTVLGIDADIDELLLSYGTIPEKYIAIIRQYPKCFVEIFQGFLGDGEDRRCNRMDG